MVETYLRQSPLAQQGLEGRAEAVRGSAGVAMVERRFPGIVDLRGQHKALSAAFELAHGFALPAEPNTTASKRDLTAFWLGPDEWWVLGPDGAQLARDLRETLAGSQTAEAAAGMPAALASPAPSGPIGEGSRLCRTPLQRAPPAAGRSADIPG